MPPNHYCSQPPGQSAVQGQALQCAVRSVEDDDERSVSGWVVQLCLWSLNPAVAFKELTDKARCVVLTSGTLAPTESFASEVGLQPVVAVAIESASCMTAMTNVSGCVRT